MSPNLTIFKQNTKRQAFFNNKNNKFSFWLCIIVVKETVVKSNSLNSFEQHRGIWLSYLIKMRQSIFISNFQAYNMKAKHWWLGVTNCIATSNLNLGSDIVFWLMADLKPNPVIGWWSKFESRVLIKFIHILT